MKQCLILLTFACFLSGCSASNQASPDGSTAQSANPNELTFKASDGHLVYSDLIRSKKQPSKGVILMFHQAGSNAAEYDSIAPRIAALGLDCIVVDQRSGGDMWGHVNRTVNKSGTGTYMEAYTDLVGALMYARSKKYPAVLAWGRSYSSSLVLKLAAENPVVKGVLCFSPGEYFDDKSVVASWAHRVQVPAFFACTEDEWADGRSQLFDALGTKEKNAAAMAGAVHGSSTLNPEKSKVAETYFTKVKRFLERWTKAK